MERANGLGSRRAALTRAAWSTMARIAPGGRVTWNNAGAGLRRAATTAVVRSCTAMWSGCQYNPSASKVITTSGPDAVNLVADVSLEPLRRNPRQHSVLVVEQADVGDTEHPGRGRELGRPYLTQGADSRRGPGAGRLPMFAVGQTEQRHLDPGRGAPGEQSAACEGFVVGVGEDGEQ